MNRFLILFFITFLSNVNSYSQNIKLTLSDKILESEFKTKSTNELKDKIFILDRISSEDYSLVVIEKGSNDILAEISLDEQITLEGDWTPFSLENYNNKLYLFLLKQNDDENCGLICYEIGENGTFISDANIIYQAKRAKEYVNYEIHSTANNEDIYITHTNYTRPTNINGSDFYIKTLKITPDFKKTKEKTYHLPLETGFL